MTPVIANERTGFMDRHASGSAIGIVNGKSAMNVGTLWRSAALMGCQFVFTVGKRYPTQASDTVKAWRTIPLWHFETFDQFKEAAPREWQLVAVEMREDAEPLHAFSHPERACYLLGAEDNGLPKNVLMAAHRIIVLPVGCLNVAVAGSIVLYDRLTSHRLPRRRLAVPA